MNTQNKNTENKIYNGIVTGVELISTSAFGIRTFKVSFLTGDVYVQINKGDGLDASCVLGKRMYFKGILIHKCFLVQSVETLAEIKELIITKVAEIKEQINVSVKSEDVIHTGRVESVELCIGSNGKPFYRIDFDAVGHPKGLSFIQNGMDHEPKVGDTYNYKHRTRGTVHDYVLINKLELSSVYAECGSL